MFKLTKCKLIETEGTQELLIYKTSWLGYTSHLLMSVDTEYNEDYFDFVVGIDRDLSTARSIFDYHLVKNLSLTARTA